MSHDERKTTIQVNQTPFHLEQTAMDATELRALIQAPPDYEVWKIIKNPDPEGQLPIDDLLVSGAIEISNGDKFRVVPPGSFGTG